MNSTTEPKTETTNIAEVVEKPDAVEVEPKTTEPANREAAKWRKQLRDTEAERDKLTQVLASTRELVLNAAIRSIRVERCHELRPEAIPEARLDPALLFTPEGALDEIKLEQSIKELYTTKPHYFRVNWAGSGLPYVPTEGTGGAITPNGRGNAWKEAFAPES